MRRFEHMASLWQPGLITRVRRQWVTIFICGLVAASDFSSRFLGLMESTGSSGQEETTLPLRELPILDQEVYVSYQEKLSEYSLPEDELLSTALVSELEPYDVANSDIFVLSGIGYQLMAVFHIESKFAVLRKILGNDEDYESIEVRVGDKLEGFAVLDIAGHSLFLAGEDEERIEVSMFDHNNNVSTTEIKDVK